MALTLFILLSDKRLYYALIEIVAFGFALRATLAAGRAGAGTWLKWLAPITIGLGLEPLARFVRLAAEFVSSDLHLPRWEAWVELFCYWAGRVVLIYGAYQMYKFVKAEAQPKSKVEHPLSDGIGWPPPIRPVE